MSALTTSSHGLADQYKVTLNQVRIWKRHGIPYQLESGVEVYDVRIAKLWIAGWSIGRKQGVFLRPTRAMALGYIDSMNSSLVNRAAIDCFLLIASSIGASKVSAEKTLREAVKVYNHIAHRSIRYLPRTKTY